jgi:hypothetical protein
MTADEPETIAPGLELLIVYFNFAVLIGVQARFETGDDITVLAALDEKIEFFAASVSAKTVFGVDPCGNHPTENVLV